LRTICTAFYIRSERHVIFMLSMTSRKSRATRRTWIDSLSWTTLLGQFMCTYERYRFPGWQAGAARFRNVHCQINSRASSIVGEKQFRVVIIQFPRSAFRGARARRISHLVARDASSAKRKPFRSDFNPFPTSAALYSRCLKYSDPRCCTGSEPRELQKRFIFELRRRDAASSAALLG